MRVKATFASRIGPKNQLVTVGVLVLSPKGLLFRGLPGMDSLEAEIQQDIDMAALKIDPASVFEYYATSGNGVTTEWSEPFVGNGKNAEEIAAKLLDTLESK